jgi:hypothetical protein
MSLTIAIQVHIKASFNAIHSNFDHLLPCLENPLELAKPHVPRRALEASILLLHNNYVDGTAKWVEWGGDSI